MVKPLLGGFSLLAAQHLLIRGLQSNVTFSEKPSLTTQASSQSLSITSPGLLFS